MPAKKNTPTDNKIIDVAHPDATAPDDTAKPIIVTNRPIMKDPMVVDKSTDKEEKPAAPTAASSVKVTLQPTAPEVPAEVAEPPKDTPPTNLPESPPVEKTKPALVPEEKPPAAVASSEPQLRPDDAAKDPKAEEKAAKEAAAREIALQKLVDGKKYFLPINSVEKRRTKHELLAGVLLSIFLILAWLDIALDAGLVHFGGLKAVTHFFSS